MTGKILGTCLLAVVVGAGGTMPSLQAAPKATKASSDGRAAILRDFNRGASLLEQYEYVKAANVFEAVLAAAPDWDAATFNLGLAYLNMEGQEGREDRLDKARQAFLDVLKSNPRHLHARFCLGLYHQHRGESQKAWECFEAVYRQDQQDPCVAYKCGETLVAMGRNEEGMRRFEQSLEIDPGFVSATYRLALEYQRAGQPKKAQPWFQRFRELSAAELTGGTVSVQNVYGMAGKYYLAAGGRQLALAARGFSHGPPRDFLPEVKRLAASAASWNWQGGGVGLPGIAVGDLGGTGRLDLCLSGIGGDGKTSIWLNDGAGRFVFGGVVASHGVSPCLGDVDNAGRLDLWLGGAGGSMLLAGDGMGHFTRRTAPGLPDTSSAFTVATRLVDIDNDGDIDLLAFRLRQGSVPAGGKALPAASSVYRNNRDGTFTDVATQFGLDLRNTPVAAVVCDDFDNDRDLDMVIFPANGKKPIAWVNDRAGKHHLLDAAATGLDVQNVISAITGDPDKSGRRSLLVFARNGVHLYLNRGGFRFEENKDFWSRLGRLGGTGGQFADVDNDGNLDIVIFDAHRKDGSRGPVLLWNDGSRGRFLDAADADPGILLSAIRTKGNASGVAADFSGKGRCDILLVPADQPPLLIQNLTRGGHWIELDLVGARKRDNKARSNGSAIGARVEIRTGRLYQQYVVGGASGPVAMLPLRIHAGLGDNAKVDWLRILWPDGVLQAETDVPADRMTKIEELPRKTSSCPTLFAWDGAIPVRFRFWRQGGAGVPGCSGRVCPAGPPRMPASAAAGAAPRRVRVPGDRAFGGSCLFRRGEADRGRSSRWHGSLSERDNGRGCGAASGNPLFGPND